jgi:hypothetical protein
MYNCKLVLRPFIAVDYDNCSFRLALETDFLRLRTKYSRALSTVFSVTLGLSARPFAWWQKQPQSLSYSCHLRTDDARGSQLPNCRWNALSTAITLLLLANLSTRQIRSVGRAAILSDIDVSFSCETALAALRPFQMDISCVVLVMNFNIMSIFNSKYDLMKSSNNLCGSCMFTNILEENVASSFLPWNWLLANYWAD